ncbi:MAG TPA: pitrilysin family protein [Sunxiuqinia sp.]|nr:pitrilysin family protein [Sunxiuqinia sp.]
MIDRTKQPHIQALMQPDMLLPEDNTLDNGIPLHLLQAGTQEVTRLDFIFEAGLWEESKPLQAAFANAMLQEGSENYSGAQIAEVFDFRGAYIQFAADQHFGLISMISLNKHLPHLMPVVEDLIKRTIFQQHEFETLVNRRRQRFLLENEKVKVLCQKKFSEVLFGKDHPYAQTVKAADFDAINKEDLLDFYKKFYHAGNCRILAAGKLDAGLKQLLNQYFGGNDWEGEKVANQSFKLETSTEKIHRVTKKEVIQSAIRIGRLGIPKGHPDYHGLEVLNSILGGFFSSRLMTNIREEKGYTYGIGSSLISFRDAGYFVIATETANSYVEDTISEVFKELARLRDELIPEVELERVRKYLLGEFIRDFDGPFAQAQAFRGVNDFGLDHAFYQDYYETVSRIDAVRLQQLAQKYLQEEEFFTVVVGA